MDLFCFTKFRTEALGATLLLSKACKQAGKRSTPVTLIHTEVKERARCLCVNSGLCVWAGTLRSDVFCPVQVLPAPQVIRSTQCYRITFISLLSAVTLSSETIVA